MLNFGKGVGKVGLRVVKRADGAAEKEVRSGVEREARMKADVSLSDRVAQNRVSYNHLPEEEVSHVHGLALATKKMNEHRRVSLEAVQVAHAVLSKLRSNELTRIVPFLAISAEDTCPVGSARHA